MDFSKFEKLSPLTNRGSSVIESGDPKIIKIAFVSIACALILLIHYVQFMNIQYTSTMIARFSQFSVIFFLIFLLSVYLEDTIYDVVVSFFLLMSIPYLYYLFKYIFNYMKKLSFYTVEGRIYILTSSLFLVAMFLILRQILFS